MFKAPSWSPFNFATAYGGKLDTIKESCDFRISYILNSADDGVVGLPNIAVTCEFCPAVARVVVDRDRFLARW